MSARESRADLHDEWLAACDALEFAQDTGRTASQMRALETAASNAYDAYRAAL